MERGGRIYMGEARCRWRCTGIGGGGVNGKGSENGLIRRWGKRGRVLMGEGRKYRWGRRAQGGGMTRGGGEKGRGEEM